MEAIKALSNSTAERVDLPTGFLRIAIADLENNPFSFPIMRQPWNRIIDELGLPPDLKKPIPASHWTGNGIPGDVPWTAEAGGRSGVWGSPPQAYGKFATATWDPPRGPLLEGPRCARSTRKGGGVLQTNAQLKEAMGECLGQLAPWEVFATWTFSRPVRETGAAYWACRHLASLEDATNGWGLARPTAANGHGYIQDGQLDLPRTRVYLPSGGWREAQVGGLVHLQALVGNLGQLVKLCGERLLTTEWGRDCCLIHRWPAGYARVFPYDPHRGAKFYVSKYITKRLAEWDLVGFPVPMPAP